MFQSRPPKIVVSFFVAALLVSGCRTEKQSPSADTSSVATKSATAAAVEPSTNGWNAEEAGPILLLSITEAVRQASVVIPNVNDVHSVNDRIAAADSLRGNEFDLFDRSGHTGTAALESISRASSEGCAAWPVGVFKEAPSRTWRIGFGYQVARAIVLDSLEGMKSADSSTVTVELARLSSAATVNADPAFEGLPFTVREAYQIQIPEGSVIIGDVVRTINEEANPREEHLLLVGEKESEASVYHTAFYSRSAGSEDEVRTNEVLAAVRFVKTNRPAIVVSFGYADGDRTALLERVANGSWKITWRSAYSGC